jgi:hypothetical protein
VFDRFRSAFVADDRVGDCSSGPSLDGWLDCAGGRSFEHGLYRVHSQQSSRASDALVRGAFPEFVGRYVASVTTGLDVSLLRI